MNEGEVIGDDVLGCEVEVVKVESIVFMFGVVGVDADPEEGEFFGLIHRGHR